MAKNQTRFTQKYTDEDLIQHLKKYYERNKKVPTKIEWNADASTPSYDVYYERFRLPWRELWTSHGYVVERNPLNLSADNRFFSKIANESDEELIELYKRFADKIGKIPTKIDLDSSDEIYNSDVFVVRFGGLNPLRRLAGFKEYNTGGVRRSKDDVIKLLKVARQEKGRRLSATEVNSIVPKSSLYRLFQTSKINEVWDEVERTD